MPNSNGIILSRRQNNRQRRMETNIRNIMSMSFQNSHASLILIIPDSNGSVISPTSNIGSIRSLEIIDTVDSLFMAFEGEVGRGGAQAPHLRRRRRRRKRKRRRRGLVRGGRRRGGKREGTLTVRSKEAEANMLASLGLKTT